MSQKFYVIHVSYIVFNCNWIATQWQLFSTHIHTQKYRERHKPNNTQNNTKILRITQKIHRITRTIHRTTHHNYEKCGPCPVFCGFYPGICLTTEEKARKNLSVSCFFRQRLEDGWRVRLQGESVVHPDAYLWGMKSSLGTSGWNVKLNTHI
jgi:hypothetical protein